MSNFWWHFAISALKISKKHFATFDFFVKMKRVSTVWVSTSLSKSGYFEGLIPGSPKGSYLIRVLVILKENLGLEKPPLQWTLVYSWQTLDVFVLQWWWPYISVKRQSNSHTVPSISLKPRQSSFLLVYRCTIVWWCYRICNLLLIFHFKDSTALQIESRSSLPLVEGLLSRL